LAGADRGDAVRIADDAIPGITRGLDERLVAVKNEIGELGLSRELPEVFGGVKLRRLGKH
jgi:hypothetical protein